MYCGDPRKRNNGGTRKKNNRNNNNNGQGSNNKNNSHSSKNTNSGNNRNKRPDFTGLIINRTRSKIHFLGSLKNRYCAYFTDTKIYRSH